MKTRTLFTLLSDTLAHFLPARNVFSAKPLAQAAVVIGLAGLFACPQTAHAFDTGPHHDLTENALGREGFGGTAIEVAQVNNWFTDYYSDAHPGIQIAAARLHFDNMPDMDMSDSTHINNYWTHLSANTKNSIQAAAQNGNVLRALTILGVSLHTVQDFYSHSNWVEAHPKSPHGAFRTETWFNSQPYPMTTDIHTGHYPNFGSDNPLDHGDTTYGINHDAPGDSPSRRHFTEAYVFAYVASREWTMALHQWVDAVDPTFWAKMQAYDVSGPAKGLLDYDSTAAYRVSEWLPKDDGHWSGPGSSDLWDFGAFMATYISVETPYEIEFLSVLLDGDLTNGLTGDFPAWNAPVVPGYGWAFGDRAVIVRTPTVNAQNNFDWPYHADFYASIGIAGQTFVTAAQRGQDSITPNWTAIKILPWSAGSADISYTLLDESALGGYQICDINPDPWNYGLNFNLDFLTDTLTGAATGQHNTPATAVVSSGQVGAYDQSQVAVDITSTPLFPPTTVDRKHLNLTITPGSVVFNLKEKINAHTGTITVLQQNATKYVTIHAVSAVTGLPIQGEVYYDSPGSDDIQVGVTDQPFPWQFNSGTESHGVGFKVWASGWQAYDPAGAGINVEVNLPED